MKRYVQGEGLESPQQKKVTKEEESPPSLGLRAPFSPIFGLEDGDIISFQADTDQFSEMIRLSGL